MLGDVTAVLAGFTPTGILGEWFVAVRTFVVSHCYQTPLVDRILRDRTHRLFGLVGLVLVYYSSYSYTYFFNSLARLYSWLPEISAISHSFLASPVAELYFLVMM